ncbi:hypothetical protein GOBAR_AA12557 [Gossypium barbadense]|uniref:Uncharacterized protein n=1 Tax=Gossypium barbadense TaxID=3634 RepID=A0A2P5XXM3_GOSBA|nr:hypothetical protein GOBAR_AA12557 [Gossypium barbadense]
MEHVDDEKVERTVALYCGTRINQNTTIQLFAELVGMEPTEDPAPSSRAVQLTICGINIDLNAAPKIDVVDDDVYHSSDTSDHEVDSNSDPDVDDVDGVPDDIDDKCMNDNGNINVYSVRN